MRKDDEIMTMIRSGHLRMVPKWRFMILAGLTAAGLALLALGCIYLANVIFYDKRQGGGFPWLVLLGALICFGLALVAAKRFDFSYKVPLAALIIAGLVAAVGLAYGLSQTGLNQRLETSGPFRPLYQYRQKQGTQTGPASGQTPKIQNGKGQPQYKKP